MDGNDVNDKDGGNDGTDDGSADGIMDGNDVNDKDGNRDGKAVETIDGAATDEIDVGINDDIVDGDTVYISLVYKISVVVIGI